MSKKYLACKELAQKINKALDCRLSVIDETGDRIQYGVKFGFDDKNEAIFLKYPNANQMFCGKGGWGSPRISDFKKFKVASGFIKIEEWDDRI